ncbi:hypothetical protein WDW86_12890 [Bdellovibrionota bacterium FG-2]
MKSQKSGLSTTIAASALTLCTALLGTTSNPAQAGTFSTGRNQGPFLKVTNMPEGLGFKLFYAYQKAFNAAKTCAALQETSDLTRLREKLLDIMANQTIDAEGEGFELTCDKGGDPSKGQLLMDNGNGKQICYNPKSDCGGATPNFLRLGWGTDLIITPMTMSGLCGRSLPTMVLSFMIDRFGNLEAAESEKVALACVRQIKAQP